MTCEPSPIIADLGGVVGILAVPDLATAVSVRTRLVSRDNAVLTDWVVQSDGSNGNDWANNSTLYAAFSASDLDNITATEEHVKVDLVVTGPGGDLPGVRTQDEITIEART